MPLRHPALTALAVLVAVAASPPLSAQVDPGDWASLNPGAGGQVQQVVLDPSVPGRAYVLSDVEGMYRTDDGGASYQFLPNGLLSIDILDLAVDPADSDRVYVATDLGLQVSDDAGGLWTPHPDVVRGSNPSLLTANPGSPGNAKLHVGEVLVDPADPDRVLVGLGNKRGSTVPAATVFRSVDRGASFAPVTFGGGSGGNENVLQTATGGGLLFAAAEDAGLWVSPDWGATWSQVPTPNGAETRSEAVAVSPEGGAVYAAFRRPNSRGNQIYTAPITNGAVGAWTLLLGENYPTDETSDVLFPDFANASFRNLQVDPRSTATEHRLLTAESNWRTGLYEVTVDRSGSAPRARWENIFYYEGREDAPFDIGYESNYPRPLSFEYAPLSWPGRQIWTTGDQTLFKVDTELPDYTEKWDAIYTSDPVQTFPSGLQTYRDLGWVSTVDFDADQYGSAVCSAKGDHGMAMSWDGGFSWEVDSTPRRPRSNTCRFVVTSSGTLYVVAHITDGYGGSSDGGELWAARLDRDAPAPTGWIFLAGGDGANGTPNGLPDHRIDYIEQNPFDADQIALSVRDEFRGTGSPGGVYMVDDLDALYAAREARQTPPRLYRLGGAGAPDAPTEKDNSVRFDPNEPGVLYVGNRNAMLRGTLSRIGWTWRPVCESGQPMKMNVWDRDGETLLVCRRVVNGRQFAQISTDDGQTWTEAFDLADLTALHETPFREDASELELWNLAGMDDKLYVNVQQNAGGLIGFGIFEATVDAGGAVTDIDDVTGGVYQPRAIRMRTVEENGRQWLFLASWGAGTWRLPIGLSDPDGIGALPWQERFAMPDGTTADPLPPSRWSATTDDGGRVEVQDGALACAGGTWRGGPFDVSGLSDVTVSLSLSGAAEVALVLDGAETALAGGAGAFQASVPTGGAGQAEVVVRCPAEGVTLDDVVVRAGRVVSFGAAADATVDASAATTPLGDAEDLAVRQSSQPRYAYLRFSLGDLDGVRVERAELALTQLNTTDVTVTAYPTDPTWDEGAVTFDGRPADTGGAVASGRTPGREGGTLVLDVTEAARAAVGGVLSLRLEGERSLALFGSKEGGATPTLTLAVDGRGTATDDAPGVAGALRLGPAVPNPSSTSARVRYELADAANVRLTLFDARGRRVQVVEEGPRAAGPHEAQIDVRDLAAGVYVYRLEAGGAAASGTAVVVR